MKNKCSHCETENASNAKYCSMCGYVLPSSEDKTSDEVKPPELKQQKKRKIDLKTSIGSVIGSVIGFFIMFYVSQALFNPSIDKQLIGVVNEINKTCPLTVDQYTTLKNTAALPDKTIQYNYILTDITHAEVKLDTVRKYLFPVVLENVKTNPGMKLFRDNEVTFIYSYSDKNGVFVTDYKIKPEMYQ